VNFAFDDDQEELRATLRRFLLSRAESIYAEPSGST
jgi:hypothetical protein